MPTFTLTNAERATLRTIISRAAAISVLEDKMERPNSFVHMVGNAVYDFLFRDRHAGRMSDDDFRRLLKYLRGYFPTLDEHSTLNVTEYAATETTIKAVEHFLRHAQLSMNGKA